MKPRLIDLKINGVKTFENQEFSINFRNTKRVSHASHDKFIVTPLSGRNYFNNVVAFAGINASGKTTALKLIDLALEVFINGMRFDMANDLVDLLDDHVSVCANIVSGNTLYRLEADLTKTDNNHAQPRFVFKEERILSRELTANESHTGLLEYHKFGKEELRSELEEHVKRFLKEGDSMLPSLLVTRDRVDGKYIGSTIRRTNFNFLLPSEAFPDELSGYAAELLAYLDESIEYLTIIEEPPPKDGIHRFRLKFFNEPEIEVGAFELERYLSSGTIRGLIVFNEVITVLQNGGYVIIDELELHINKLIAENIISFFQSELNVHGATLVFSTHYSELLNSIRRKDAIMVLIKSSDGIRVDSLAKLAKAKTRDRTDIQNSDLILSGIFKTAPSYRRYMAVRKRIKDEFSN